MIDECPLGHLAPRQLAERTLVRARLTGRCRSLPDRAADLTPAELQIGALMVTASGLEESATTREG